MTGRRPVRLRASTIILITVFVGAAVLYLVVRPAPTTRPVYIPATTATSIRR
jgi:hypothetical protein